MIERARKKFMRVKRLEGEMVPGPIAEKSFFLDFIIAAPGLYAPISTPVGSTLLARGA